MPKKTFNRVILVLILLFLSTCIATKFIPDTVESRSIGGQLLLDGYIPFTLFLGVLGVILVHGIVLFLSGYFLKGILLGGGAGFLLLTVSLFAALIYREIGVFKQDRIVYSSSVNPDHKLIVQHYETGVTGNSHWRVIKVKDIRASFRTYQSVDYSFDQLNSAGKSVLGSWSIDYHQLPKKINYQGEEFRLESTWMFNEKIIKERQQRPTR